MPEARIVKLKVLRQDSPNDAASRRWEEFSIPWHPQMNIISALMQIQRNPQTTEGKKTPPVVWDSCCLEEVCGACTMVINGRVRQACSALVDQIAPEGGEITVAPMTKFPLVRDLIVDRSRMFENLKKVKAWVTLDGSHELGAGPRQSAENQEEAYPLSRCMTCGCCLEACPQIPEQGVDGKSTGFIGPAAINQVRLFNLHPSGKMHAPDRLETLMEPGGIADCGKAQNCVEVCPKEIPLVDSIALVSRETTKHMLFGWLLK